MLIIYLLSKIDPGDKWYINVWAYSYLNAWKADQISKLFEKNIGECENLAMYTPLDLGLFFALFLPTTVALGEWVYISSIDEEKRIMNTQL